MFSVYLVNIAKATNHVNFVLATNNVPLRKPIAQVAVKRHGVNLHLITCRCL